LAATLRRLRAMPARGYAGAALAAVLTGIVINALILQHERHPAPFFAARAPAVEAPPQAARPDDSTIGAVLPPTRPADLGVDPIGDVLRADSAKDAIGEMLRADSAKDAEKQRLAAQNALIKLGYSLKADGSPGAATAAALRDFERVHSLPLSSDLTPRLIKQLTAAANAAPR
jgi:peptidoglycan hydrolase-like protein with peptidoglycan-binding domain